MSTCERFTQGAVLSCESHHECDITSVVYPDRCGYGVCSMGFVAEMVLRGMVECAYQLLHVLQVFQRLGWFRFWSLQTLCMERGMKGKECIRYHRSVQIVLEAENAGRNFLVSRIVWRWSTIHASVAKINSLNAICGWCLWFLTLARSKFLLERVLCYIMVFEWSAAAIVVCVRTVGCAGPARLEFYLHTIAEHGLRPVRIHCSFICQMCSFLRG